MDLVSIIVPVYNAEKYIRRCVRSLMAQTYTDLEIILVDDGSPDNCGSICDDLAMEDNRIKVIHKENGGVSDARNCGVKEATGEYITFIDSDDFVSMEYVEYLYRLLKENNADISCCCYVGTEGDMVEYGTDQSLPNAQKITGREACKRLHGDLYRIFCIVCAKLYKRDIITMYPFFVGRRHEDEAIACNFLYASKYVVVGNRELYAYYKNSNSFMHTNGKNFNEDMVWALEERAAFFEQNNDQELLQCVWKSLFAYYVSDSLSHNGRCDSVLKNFKDGKSLSKRTEFELVLYNFSPFFYKLFVKTKYFLCKLKGKIRKMHIKVNT